MMLFCFILALCISVLALGMGMKLLIKGCKTGEVFCGQTVRYTSYLIIFSALLAWGLTMGMGVNMLMKRGDMKAFGMMGGQMSPEHQGPKRGR